MPKQITFYQLKQALEKLGFEDTSVNESYIKFGLFQIPEKMSLHFAWKDGRMEDERLPPILPTFHP